MKPRPAIFLDRDGVLNKDVGYPHHLHDAVLYKDVIPALREMQSAGYLLLVISNQSGVQRGLFRLEDVKRFNNAIAKQLREAKIWMTRQNFYICPHGPNDGCECRKPFPGLLLQAARQHSVRLVASFTIGDSESDIEAGLHAGTRTILLNRKNKHHKTKADWVVSTLWKAAEIVSLEHNTNNGDSSIVLAGT